MTDYKLKNLMIHLTRQCNLKCKHCYVNAGKKDPDELSYVDWINFIDTLPDSVSRCVLTGGECLLFPGIDKIINKLHQKKIPITILSNGTKITDEIAEFLSQKIDHINISIDGLEKDHDNFRGVNGAFQKTIEGIKILNKYKIRPIINMVLTEETTNSLIEILSYLSDFDLDSIQLSPIHKFGRSNDRTYFSNNILSKLLEYKEYFQLNNIDFQYDASWDIVEDRESHLCQAGISFAVVLPNGDFAPCPALIDKSFVAGNVFKNKIAEIWNSPESKNFNILRNLKVKDILSHCSDDCKFKSKCFGGCRAEAYSITGDLTKPNLMSCTILEEQYNIFNCINSC